MRVLADELTPQRDSVGTFKEFAGAFPSAVTITRTSDSDFKSRQLVASLDGITVATLLWGDSVTCDLPPGVHRLRVHNTLVWKTLEFNLSPGEQLFIEAVNRTGPGTILMTILLGIGPLYVTLNRM